MTHFLNKFIFWKSKKYMNFKGTLSNPVNLPNLSSFLYCFKPQAKTLRSTLYSFLSLTSHPTSQTWSSSASNISRLQIPLFISNSPSLIPNLSTSFWGYYMSLSDLPQIQPCQSYKSIYKHILQFHGILERCRVAFYFFVTASLLQCTQLWQLSFFRDVRTKRPSGFCGSSGLHNIFFWLGVFLINL